MCSLSNFREVLVNFLESPPGFANAIGGFSPHLAPLKGVQVKTKKMQEVPTRVALRRNLR